MRLKMVLEMGLAAGLLATGSVLTGGHLVFQDGQPYPGNPARVGELSYQVTALPVVANGEVLIALASDPVEEIDPAAPIVWAYDGNSFSRFTAFSDREEFYYEITSLGADEEGNVAASISGSIIYSVLEYWDGTTTTTYVADQTLFPGTNTVMDNIRIGDVRGGKVAFFAGADGFNNEQGLFIADEAGLTTLVKSGDLLPGMEAPLQSFAFQSFAISLNADGSQAAFAGSLRQEGGDVGALYLWDGSDYTLIMEQGQTVAEGTVGFISPRISYVGDAVMFSFSAGNSSYLVSYENGAYEVLLKTGDVLEGIGELGFFTVQAGYDDGVLINHLVGSRWQVIRVDAEGSAFLFYESEEGSLGNIFHAHSGGFVDGNLVFQGADWSDGLIRRVIATGYEGPGGNAANLFPFSDGTAYEGGFRFVNWMGWLYEEFYPFVYHYHLGWLYVVPGSNEGNLWFYEFGGLEWGWTANFFYPAFWHANSDTIYSYVADSLNPRLFTAQGSSVQLTETDVIGGGGEVDVGSLDGKTIVLADSIGTHTAILSGWNGSDGFTSGVVVFNHQGNSLPMEVTVASFLNGRLLIDALVTEPTSSFLGSRAIFSLELDSLTSGNYTLSFSVVTGVITIVEDGSDIPGTYTVTD